jgi:hypothetical protein
VAELHSRRRVVTLVVVLLGAACIHTTAPTGFTFQYQIRALACDTSCAAPDSTVVVTSAARGDTVWLQHVMSLVGAVDSFTPQAVTLRPDCEVNVLVIAGSTTLRSIPTPTCPDSTYSQWFQLAGIYYPQILVRYTQWVVDAGLAAGSYGVRGHVVVQPRLEPTLTFDVQ